MSNSALDAFMLNLGGKLIRTPVGDRHVVEAMRRHGAMLGGEQSGHLIFRAYSTTGDGLLAALQILRSMREQGKPLSELAGQLQLFPQVLLSVEVARKPRLEECPALLAAVDGVERRLAGRGRVLLRYSGTEPVCRVMVEGESASGVRAYAEELAAVVRRELAS
jgi:phosphoglucosamine mutase